MHRVSCAGAQADLFGRCIAMNANTALIGAPNRDWFYSGINGGAAFFEDLGFLNVRFSAREYEVLEGDGRVSFHLNRCCLCPYAWAPLAVRLSGFAIALAYVGLGTVRADARRRVRCLQGLR